MLYCAVLCYRQGSHHYLVSGSSAEAPDTTQRGIAPRHSRGCRHFAWLLDRASFSLCPCHGAWSRRSQSFYLSSRDWKKEKKSKETKTELATRGGKGKEGKGSTHRSAWLVWCALHSRHRPKQTNRHRHALASRTSAGSCAAEESLPRYPPPHSCTYPFSPHSSLILHSLLVLSRECTRNGLTETLLPAGRRHRWHHPRHPHRRLLLQPQIPQQGQVGQEVQGQAALTL